MSEQALPATLPNIKTAKLPAMYEAARKQLSECARVDECKDWSDKAAALASYAKQVNDESLLVMARRIKLRAHDRMGELLNAIDAAHGANQNIREGAHPKVHTRTQVARDAGLSEHQQKTAMRIHAVPREEFEAAVESEVPPTVTELAQRGVQPRAPENDKRPDPNEAFRLAIGGHLADMRRLADRGWEDTFVAGISEPVARKAIGEIDEIQTWLKQLKEKLERYCVQL
jgi:hypothetical protein